MTDRENLDRLVAAVKAMRKCQARLADGVRSPQPMAEARDAERRLDALVREIETPPSLFGGPRP